VIVGSATTGAVGSWVLDETGAVEPGAGVGEWGMRESRIGNRI
jgi:hypothetical protein